MPSQTRYFFPAGSFGCPARLFVFQLLISLKCPLCVLRPAGSPVSQAELVLHVIALWLKASRRFQVLNRLLHVAGIQERLAKLKVPIPIIRFFADDVLEQRNRIVRVLL